MRFNRSVPSVAFNRFLLSIALLFGLLGLAYPAHAQDADTTPPTFVSATTSRDGIEVKVTFSEDIAVSSLVSTLAQRYGVSVGGILKDVMTVTVDGKDNVLFSSSYSGSVLTLRLENPQVRTGQVVKVAYSNVFAREPGGALTDLVGNAVEPFGLQTVTNASVDDSALNFGAQPVLNKTTLSICEGQTGTYGVSLPSQPTGGSLGIGMLFSPYDALYPSSEYLSFNQENWETARTISVYTEVDGDDYTNWGLVYHRLDGVDITKTFDTVIRILILERAHADCNTPARGAPTISGTAQVGQTLTASTSGISDTDGLDTVSYSYQWLADDTDIDGAANSTYTLQASDNGKTIKVRVTFTDDVGKEESLTSAATAAVAPPPNSPATGAPTISGTAQVGQTLTASTSGISDSDGLTNPTYSYQWLADDTEIDGATSSTYTVQSSDNGKVIKVRVTFTDDAGHDESLTSGGTTAVVMGGL